MAAPQEQTLAEVRAEVLARLGFARAGSATVRNADLINSFIRQAVRTLALEVNWQSLFKELELVLVEGQTRYEFPDEASIGGIEYMVVIDASNRRWVMESGIRPQEVPTVSPGATPMGDIPRLWRTINNEIEIQPSPSADALKLLVGYVAQVPQLVDDSEVMPFDSEAIIQKAVLLGRVHYDRPGVSEGAREFERYLARVKARQNEARDIANGGAMSALIRPVAMQRLGSSNVGRDAVWSDSWRPW
jgi:hypothetical protein